MSTLIKIEFSKILSNLVFVIVVHVRSRELHEADFTSFRSVVVVDVITEFATCLQGFRTTTALLSSA